MSPHELLEPRAQGGRRIRVVLVGLPPSFAELLARAIGSHPDLLVVGRRSRGTALTDLAEVAQADLIIGAAEHHPPADVLRLLGRRPGTRVLLLVDEGRGARLFQAPARETVLGELSGAQLIDVIREGSAPGNPERPQVRTDETTATVEPTGQTKGATPMNGVATNILPCDCKDLFPGIDMTSMSATLTDPSGNPADIISVNDPFSIQVEIRLTGPAVPALCLCFCCCVYLDEFGNCPPIPLPGNCDHQCLDACKTTWVNGVATNSVTFDFNFPPVGPQNPRDCPCPYELVVVSSAMTKCDPSKPIPIACKCGPLLIQFMD